jgi:hypothetical protein
MPHDKIKAAARQRMTETGEPYSVARRAVINEHKQATGHVAKAAPAIPDRIRAEQAARVGVLVAATGGAMQAAIDNMVRTLEQASKINVKIPDLTAFERAVTGAERATTENIIRMVQQANMIADKINAPIAHLTALERATTENVIRMVEQADRLTATIRQMGWV